MKPKQGAGSKGKCGKMPKNQKMRDLTHYSADSRPHTLPKAWTKLVDGEKGCHQSRWTGVEALRNSHMDNKYRGKSTTLQQTGSFSYPDGGLCPGCQEKPLGFYLFCGLGVSLRDLKYLANGRVRDVSLGISMLHLSISL